MTSNIGFKYNSYLKGNLFKWLFPREYKVAQANKKPDTNTTVYMARSVYPQMPPRASERLTIKGGRDERAVTIL